MLQRVWFGKGFRQLPHLAFSAVPNPVTAESIGGKIEFCSLSNAWPTN
jgi:hypothetical protein